MLYNSSNQQLQLQIANRQYYVVHKRHPCEIFVDAKSAGPQLAY